MLLAVQTDTLKEPTFYVDPAHRGSWIAAIKRENWKPTEYSFVCSAHVVTGKKAKILYLQILSLVHIDSRRS